MYLKVLIRTCYNNSDHISFSNLCSSLQDCYNPKNIQSNFSDGEPTNPVRMGDRCSSVESRVSDDEGSVSQLKEVLTDGTQIVELNRRHNGPIGFYIARGSTQFKHGKRRHVTVLCLYCLSLYANPLAFLMTGIKIMLFKTKYRGY